MKQKKIDYKIKNGYSKKKSKSHKSPRTSSGLYLVIIAFIVLTTSSYYLLNNIKKKVYQKKAVSFLLNLPPLNHFLLINESKIKKRGLNSVVMLTFHRDTKTTILSFFPSEASFDKKYSLAHYYIKNGVQGLLNQFQNFFNISFHYLVLFENFYEKTSQRYKNVLVHLETKKNLVFHYSLLKPSKNTKNLYLIKGKNLIKYLLFHQQSKNLSSIKSKRVRLLYTITTFLSSGNQLVNKLKNDPKRETYFGSSNLSLTKSIPFLKALSVIKPVNIFSYPFTFKKRRKIFFLKTKSKDYLQFIHSSITDYKQTYTFNTQYYLQVMQSLGFIDIKKKIRLKILNHSGRDYQYSSSTFKTFFHILNLDIISYLDDKQPITKSYLINSSHNLEMTNYVQGVLRINKVYNSGNRVNPFYDLILIMGKDFPKISSKEL